MSIPGDNVIEIKPKTETARLNGVTYVVTYNVPSRKWMWSFLYTETVIFSGTAESFADATQEACSRINLLTGHGLPA